MGAVESGEVLYDEEEDGLCLVFVEVGKCLPEELSWVHGLSRLAGCAAEAGLTADLKCSDLRLMRSWCGSEDDGQNKNNRKRK